jgi:RIO kinase 1
MEFIGGADGAAAPRLVDAVVEDPAALYEDLVHEIGRMAREAHLVHGDLSPYNVLFHEGHPVLIDVAQAVASDHPDAVRLMDRDVRNFARFLGRIGFSVEPSDFLEAVGVKTIGPPPQDA